MTLPIPDRSNAVSARVPDCRPVKGIVPVSLCAQWLTDPHPQRERVIA